MQKHPERWRMLAHSLLQFVPIKKNRFLERNKCMMHPNDYMTYQCQCEPISHSFGKSRLTDISSYDCGEQCLNRSVNQDCLPNVCPVGEGCRNRRFQLHQNAYVYPVKTSNKGWGLSAGEFIKKGQFVMQYVGEVFYVDSDIGKQRIEKYKNRTCTYMMRTENGEVIDPTTHGNIARFINHSCEPNCVTRKWTVLGETSVGIFALKDIQEDEELSFDYQFDTFHTPFTRCYCGAKKCKGFLGLGVFEDDAENLNAPICKICKNIISDSSQLLVCKGTCRSVFHYECAAQHDKRVQLLAAEKSMKKQKYLCKNCYYEVRGKKKPGRKKDNNDSGQEGAKRDGQGDDERSAEKKECEKLILTDPEARKFLENTPENLVVDKVIKREIYWIEKQTEDKNGVVSDFNSDSSSDGKIKRKKIKKSKKRKHQYSAFYNFYFELCFRLKKRMKENLSNFKFRKVTIQEDSDEFGITGPSGQRKSKKTQKRRKSFQSSLSACSSPVAEKAPARKRATTASRHLAQKAPKRVQRALIDSDKQSLDFEDQSEKPASFTNNKSEDQSMIQASSKQSSLSSSQKQNSRQSYFSKSDQEEAEDELVEAEMEESEDSEREELQEEDEAEEDRQDSLLDDDEEGEDSIEDIPFSDEESEEDESQDSSMESSDESQNDSESDQSMPAEASEEPIQTKRKLQRAGAQPIKTQRGNRKNLLLKTIQEKLADSKGHSQSVRKQSLVEKDLIDQAKAQVQAQIRDLVDKYLESELAVTSQGECTNYKVNLYDQIFKVVFDANTDILECVPNLFFTWSAQWGNLVTVRITTDKRQYRQLMEIVYIAGNLLQKSNLLSEFVGLAPESMIRQSCLPFLIMKIMVGKNQLKKIIGYQGRTLGHYRKKYAVNFDFDEQLINDLVYTVDETSPFYVFGRGRDVIKVCQQLRTELDQIQVKTLHITKEEQNFILLNIKEIKPLIDPCEIRVKRVIKEKTEINHPFYAVPNLSREVCLIGNEQEIIKAELRLYEFYSMRIDAPDITKTSICFLLPMMLHGEKRGIKTELMKIYPDLQFLAIDPIYPRKHITIYLQGPWKILMKAKEILIKIVDPSFNRIWQPSYKNFEEFQIFTLHQSLKFCFKQLKRSQLEKSCKFQTHWDVTSIEVEQIGSQLQLRLQEEQEEYSIVTRLLGKEYLFRMRQILSKEVHIDPTSIFDHPDLQEKFQALRPEQQQLIIETRKRRKYLKQFRTDKFKQMLRYMRVHDQETCLNVLFVLSSCPQSLEDLMKKLTLTKDLVIIFAQNLIQDLLSLGKYPSLSSYVKYRQNVEAKKIVERNMMLRQKRRDKAVEDFQRYKEYKEAKLFEQQHRRRRSRSRSRDSYNETEKIIQSQLPQEPSVESSVHGASQQQAYEVQNPTQPNDDSRIYRRISDQSIHIQKKTSREDYVTYQRAPEVEIKIQLRADFRQPYDQRTYDPKEPIIERKEIVLSKQQSMPVPSLTEIKPRESHREPTVSNYSSEFKKPAYNEFQKPPTLHRQYTTPVQTQTYVTKPDSYFSQGRSIEPRDYNIKKYTAMRAIDSHDDDSISNDLIFEKLPSRQTEPDLRLKQIKRRSRSRSRGQIERSYPIKPIDIKPVKDYYVQESNYAPSNKWQPDPRQSHVMRSEHNYERVHVSKTNEDANRSQHDKLYRSEKPKDEQIDRQSQHVQQYAPKNYDDDSKPVRRDFVSQLAKRREERASNFSESAPMIQDPTAVRVIDLIPMRVQDKKDTLKQKEVPVVSSAPTKPDQGQQQREYFRPERSDQLARDQPRSEIYRKAMFSEGETSRHREEHGSQLSNRNKEHDSRYPNRDDREYKHKRSDYHREHREEHQNREMQSGPREMPRYYQERDAYHDKKPQQEWSDRTDRPNIQTEQRSDRHVVATEQRYIENKPAYKDNNSHNKHQDREPSLLREAHHVRSNTSDHYRAPSDHEKYNKYPNRERHEAYKYSEKYSKPREMSSYRKLSVDEPREASTYRKPPVDDRHQKPPVNERHFSKSNDMPQPIYRSPERSESKSYRAYYHQHEGSRLYQPRGKDDGKDREYHHSKSYDSQKMHRSPPSRHHHR